MDKWTQVWENRYGEEAANVVDEIWIGGEELELDHLQVRMTKYRAQHLVPRLEVQKMKAPEMEKLTSNQYASAATGVMENIFINALQVGNDASRERVEISLFILVGEVIVAIVQQGKMNPLLMRNIEAFT